MDLIASPTVSILTIPRFLDRFVDVSRGNSRTMNVVWMMNREASRGVVSVDVGSVSRAVQVNRSSNNGVSALNRATDIFATGDVKKRVVLRRFDGVVDGIDELGSLSQRGDLILSISK